MCTAVFLNLLWSLHEHLHHIACNLHIWRQMCVQKGWEGNRWYRNENQSLAWLFWLYISNNENILKSGIKVFFCLLKKIEPSLFSKALHFYIVSTRWAKSNNNLLEVYLKLEVSLYKPVYSRFLHELYS